MPQISAKQEMELLIKDLEAVFDVYAAEMEAVGKQRHEILKGFANRLEAMEVAQMRTRLQQNVYGRKIV